jgi:hypothetical protein
MMDADSGGGSFRVCLQAFACIAPSKLLPAARTLTQPLTITCPEALAIIVQV